MCSWLVWRCLEGEESIVKLVNCYPLGKDVKEKIKAPCAVNHGLDIDYTKAGSAWASFSSRNDNLKTLEEAGKRLNHPQE